MRGRVVGVLSARVERPGRQWTLEDQDLAASIGDFASVTLEAARRREVEEQLWQSQKMEAIGLLAGGVAHDFYHKLGVILMSTDVALESLDRNHPAIEDLQNVSDAGLRAGELTNKLLAFSRHDVMTNDVVDLRRSVEEFSFLLSVS